MVSEFRMQRTLKGFTQSELGDLVGVSQGYINQIELLKVKRVSDSTGSKLTKVLGRPIEELLEIAI